jgi:hypothetical protein
MPYNVKTLINEMKKYKIEYQSQIGNLKHKGIQVHINKRGELYNEDMTHLLTQKEASIFMNNYKYNTKDLYLLLRSFYHWHKCGCVSYIDSKILRKYIHKMYVKYKKSKDIYEILDKIFSNFDVRDMFTINELLVIFAETKRWKDIVLLIKEDIRYIDYLDVRHISKISFYHMDYECIDSILINVLLISEDIDKQKLNKLLKSMICSTQVDIYSAICQKYGTYGLTILKTILTKYVNDDNALKTLSCYRRNMKLFYLYATLSKKTFHISKLKINNIYFSKVPNIIHGKLPYEDLCRTANGKKFIKNNPERVMINKNSIIGNCINNHRVVIDIFGINPELLKYCIYYKKTFSQKDLKTIIKIYKDVDMILTADILITLLGKSILKKDFNMIHMLGTIIDHIE